MYISYLERLSLLVIQHDPDDEPVAPPLDPEFFEFDCEYSCLNKQHFYSSHSTVHKDDISREQLKELLYEEIMSFRPAPIT